ncbi:MAG: hypothetical protein U5L95_04535 [Candidatus Saccharibacteria bacterium]|nr:hypothetical protein [Candidatus Saccharibacteria bacterium]
MPKQKNTPPPEEDKRKELEEKIDEMLDPRRPDRPEIKVVGDDAKEKATDDKLPTKIEIKNDGKTKKAGKKSKKNQKEDGAKSEEPSGAPEVSSKKTAVTERREDEPESDETPDPAEDGDDSQETGQSEEETESPEEEADEEASTEDTPDEKEPEENPDEEPETPATDSEATESKDDKNDKPAANPALDEAVDDIAKEESDKLLESTDTSESSESKPAKTPFRARLKAFFKAWWHNKYARYGTICVLLLLLAAGAIIPTSRYFVLNTLGVRSSASVKVFDQSTLQPLKNVTVEINGVRAKTDIDGVANVGHIKLGKTDLLITKRAFSSIERPLTVGWGSNPLPDERLTPVGAQYEFLVTDYVSGEPVQGVEAVSGEEASALSNENGEIKLTLDMPDEQFEVQIIGEEFRNETLTMNAEDEDVRKLELVPDKKHAFVSRRDGTYDIYSAYANGQDEQLLLKGSGEEREDITLVPHPSRDVAALVSTRSGKRNDDGYQLSTLTILNVKDSGDPKTVVDSERIQIIGWQNERLVFVQIRSGTSAANPKRHQLKTYNLEQEVVAELASANYFNDVMLANDVLLFAPSSAYAKEPAALYRINPDGSDQRIVHPNEVWSMFRNTYENVIYTTGSRDWFDLDLNSLSTGQREGEPNQYDSRVYVDSPDGTKSLRVENRDGKGNLLVYNKESGEENSVAEMGGLRQPAMWLNNSTVVFRVKTDAETADYVASLRGGEAKKLVDVTDAAGLERWYYY